MANEKTTHEHVLTHLLALLGIDDPQAFFNLVASWKYHVNRVMRWFNGFASKPALLVAGEDQAEFVMPHRTDPNARVQIEMLEARVLELEDTLKKATEQPVPDAFPPRKKKCNDPN